MTFQLIIIYKYIFYACFKAESLLFERTYYIFSTFYIVHNTICGIYLNLYLLVQLRRLEGLSFR